MLTSAVSVCGKLQQSLPDIGIEVFALISVNLDWLTHEAVCWGEQRGVDGPYQITNRPIIFDLLSKVRTQEKG